jgi:hypothetical protein
MQRERTPKPGALISDDSTGPIHWGLRFLHWLCESWGSRGKGDVQAAVTELFLLGNLLSGSLCFGESLP